MNNRFARLRKDWLLRGWTNVPRALVNWRTGDFHELGQDVFYVAQSCDGRTDFGSMAFLPRHNALLDRLIAAGIAEECGPGEATDAGQEYRKADNPVIRGLLWSITGLCNLNCRHCFMEAPSRRFGDFSFADICDLLNQFEQANVPEVALTGGEPFLRRDLPEILAMLERKKIGLAEIFTNGVLVTDAILAAITRHGFRPFFKISFDGRGTHDYMRGVAGSEERTIEGSKKVKAGGFPLTVITSVDAVTRGNLAETYKLMKELGTDGWWLAPPVECGNWRGTDSAVSMDDMIDISVAMLQRWLADGRPFDLKLWRFGLFPRAGKDEGASPPPATPDSWNCAGTHSRPYLLPDGTLLPCGGYTGTGLLDTMPNLRKQPLSAAWSRSALREICDLRRRDVIDRNAECADCGFFGECGGGCRVIALTQTGELMAKDPLACLLFRDGYIQRFREIARQAVSDHHKPAADISPETRG